MSQVDVVASVRDLLLCFSMCLLTTGGRSASVRQSEFYSVFSTMVFKWFNACEAVAVGSSLADSFANNDVPARARARSNNAGSGRIDIQRLLQRAVQEVHPLKLNVFKRAKLLGSFKWRLQERGIDAQSAHELTHLLLVQLNSRRITAVRAHHGVGQKLATNDSKRRVSALLAEADALFAGGDYRRAADRLTAALVIDPVHASAHNKLGTALAQLGRYQEADQEFRRAIAADPKLAHAQSNLGAVQYLKGDFEAAEAAQRRAVKLDPKNPEVHVALGKTLGTVSRVRDARRAMDTALGLDPRRASALYGLGWLEAMQGRHDKAQALYRRALESDPKRVEVWAALAQLRRMTSADSQWRNTVQQLIADGVTPLEESSLRFALGKYCDDLEKFPDAFTHYRRANELQKQAATPYDRAARESFVDNMIHTYSRERLAHSLAGSSDNERPIFVIGMMRSGTSLVEQIIASHPCAAAAGELDYWNTLVHKRRTELQCQPPEPATARELIAGYLRVLTRNSTDEARVVDKSNMNSDLVGLIHLLLPRARFIYLRRDAADTCLSCYFQNFTNAAAFTMDLNDLAHYYRGHHRLLSHWRAALPQEAFLEVPYAQLVADQEGWSRRIIEFVGLEWDPQVLEYHKSERVVVTASSWQVRQKIYTSSVGRWKNYQKFIGPLLKLRDLPP